MQTIVFVTSSRCYLDVSIFILVYLSEEVCSFILPVLAGVVRRRGKKSVVCVARCVAVLVPVHRIPSLLLLETDVSVERCDSDKRTYISMCVCASVCVSVCLYVCLSVCLSAKNSGTGRAIVSKFSG